jgi:hypothetical protein
MPDTRLLQDVLADIRARTQTENMTEAYPNAQLIEWLNKGRAVIHDIQVKAKGADYFEDTNTFTTNGAAEYPLPSMLQLLDVQCNIGGVIHQLQQFTRAERALLMNPDTPASDSPPRYRVREEIIELRPVPDTGIGVTLYYVPYSPVINTAANVANTNVNIVDAGAGLGYLIDYVCLQIAEREHDEVFMATLKESMSNNQQRLEATVTKRDAAGPMRVTDVTLAGSDARRRRRRGY